MKLRYYGYDWPQACMSSRSWLFRYWHDTFTGKVAEERGIQIFGCYFIFQRPKAD